MLKSKRAFVVFTIMAAAAAVWFWALRPLGFASYLSSTGATDADIIRRYWPQRLVQPEWVSATPDVLMNWHIAELCARVAVVAVLWSLAVWGFLYGFKRGRMRPTIRCIEPARRADEQEVDTAQAGGLKLGSCTK